MCVSTTPNANIYGVDLKQREVRWRVNAWKSFGARKGDMGWGFPESPLLHGDKVIFNACSRFDETPPLIAVDIRTGKLVKKIDVATYIASSVAVSENAAYTGDHDGKFSCVDLQDEKLVWSWTNERARLPFLASPSVNQKFAVIGNEDKYT